MTGESRQADQVCSEYNCKNMYAKLTREVCNFTKRTHHQFGLTTRMCSSRSCFGVASDGAVIIGNSPPKIAVNIGILRSLSRESVSAITSNNPIGFYGCQPVTPIRHLRAQNSGIARGKDWDVTCRHHNV